MSNRHHVVMFPFMAQGHIIPFLELSKLIARRSGFTITILNTPLNIRALRPKVESARQADTALDIRLAELPFCSSDHGLPSHTENTDSLQGYHSLLPLFEASEHLRPHFEQFLRQISQQEGRPPLCIISDMFLGWTLDVADEFGIPRIQFCTSGAYGTLVCYSLWTHLPHIKTDSDVFVLPDMKHVSLHRSQLADIRNATGSDPWSLFLNRQIRRNMSSWGSVCNSFEALEHGSLEHMRKSTGQPVWAVGPLLPSSLLSSAPCTANSNLEVWLRGQETGADVVACLQWLDSQKPSTVLYVSFGSQNSISASHMKVLALGLELSQRPFIWVVRPPLGIPLNAEFSPGFLPDGFEDRIREKKQGFVIRGWAPQLAILSHPSTGGFLSHCGWNSILESLSLGVPIIGWPLASDQFFNSKLLEEELGVCVELWRGKEGELTTEKVERTVRILMEEERGIELKKRAMEIRDAARAAVCEREGEKGSSVCDLDEMIQKLISDNK